MNAQKTHKMNTEITSMWDLFTDSNSAINLDYIGILIA